MVNTPGVVQRKKNDIYIKNLRSGEIRKFYTVVGNEFEFVVQSTRSRRIKITFSRASRRDKLNDIRNF